MYGYCLDVRGFPAYTIMLVGARVLSILSEREKRREAVGRGRQTNIKGVSEGGSEANKQAGIQRNIQACI